MKAYSYLRFSTPEQSQGDSFRRQTALAESYATEYGLDLDTELRFTDLGVSAFHGKNSDTGALSRFLHGLGTGEIETPCFLLVESLDRLSRAAILEAQGLFNLILSRGVTVITLADRRSYSYESVTANPTDLILSLLIMIRAHEESLTKSKRLKQAWVGKRQRVEAGQALMTSKTPGWLRAVDGPIAPGAARIEVLPDRAAIVQRIFALTLAGQGKEAIARTLNSEGIPPFRTGTQWHPSYVQKVLANPAVIGTLTTSTVERVNGKQYRQPVGQIPGYYPPIIDPDTFARVQALKSTVVRTKGAAVVQSMLAGLATCPLCDARMPRISKGSTAKASRPYLVCSRAKMGMGCEYRAIRLEYVEDALRASYHTIAESLMGYGDDELPKALAKLEAEEAGCEDRIEAVITEIEEDGRSPALSKRRRELESRLADLQKDIAAKRAAMGTKGLQARLAALGAAIETGTPASVNTALRELFSSVVVDHQTGEMIMQSHSGATCRVPYRWESIDSSLAIDG